jgi:hypothetical protein
MKRILLIKMLAILFSLTGSPSAKIITHIGVQLNPAACDSLKENTAVPNDSALLVFISDYSLEIKSNMDKLSPIRDGSLYKVLVPVVPNGKRIITLEYKNTDVDLNFGVVHCSNSLPILMEKEIRVFNVQFYSRVKIVDVTKEWKNKDYTVTPIEKQGNALLVFTSLFEADSFKFSSDAPIISIKSKTPGKYELAIQSINQTISIYSPGFDTGYVFIDSIAGYDWKRYELQLPRDPYRKSITLCFLSSPSGTNVHIKQKPFGITPLTDVPGFMNGSYPVTFAMKNYTVVDTVITVDDNWLDRQIIFAKLKALPPATQKNPFVTKRNFLWLTSCAALTAVCSIAGIVANEYSERNYSHYKQLNGASGSNQYEESWNTINKYKNLRNGFYIGAGCFGIVSIIISRF